MAKPQPTGQEHQLKNDAIAYVTSYLLKKCLQHHNCKTCAKLLIRNELDTSYKMFVYYKAHREAKGPFGGLLAPTNLIVQYVNKIEDMLLAKFPTFMQLGGIGKNLEESLSVFMLPDCAEFPSDYLLKLFVRMRLHYIVKFGNRALSRKKRKNNKYFKIAHL